MAWPQFPVNQGPSGPGMVGASGTLGVAGVVCRLLSQRARKWSILFDGSNVGTAALSVSIQVYNSTSGLWVTPSNLNLFNLAGANPVSIVNTTSLWLALEGPVEGLGLNIPSFGTSTGTFTGIILAL